MVRKQIGTRCNTRLWQREGVNVELSSEEDFLAQQMLKSSQRPIWPRVQTPENPAGAGRVIMKALAQFTVNALSDGQILRDW